MLSTCFAPRPIICHKMVESSFGAFSFRDIWSFRFSSELKDYIKNGWKLILSLPVIDVPVAAACATVWTCCTCDGERATKGAALFTPVTNIGLLSINIVWLPAVPGKVYKRPSNTMVNAMRLLTQRELLVLQLSTKHRKNSLTGFCDVPCACVTAPPMVTGLTVTVPWLTPVTPAPAVLTITLLGRMMEFPPPTETAWPPWQQVKDMLNNAALHFSIEHELICRERKSLGATRP